MVFLKELTIAVVKSHMETLTRKNRGHWVPRSTTTTPQLLASLYQRTLGEYPNTEYLVTMYETVPSILKKDPAKYGRYCSGHGRYYEQPKFDESQFNEVIALMHEQLKPEQGRLFRLSETRRRLRSAAVAVCAGLWLVRVLSLSSV